ncbi:hypothetical protein [Polaromonas sp. CG9_12]|nr:hypothetical protein [Polaromonas sp. CG9_12]
MPSTLEKYSAISAGLSPLENSQFASLHALAIAPAFLRRAR